MHILEGFESWLAAGAALGAVGLAIFAAALLAISAEDRDLAKRLRAVARPAERQALQRVGPGLGARLLRPLLDLGERLRRSAVFSERDLASFQKALAAAGIDPRIGVSAFIGTKALLLVLLPLTGWGWAWLDQADDMGWAMAVAGGLALAVLLPNWIINALRRPYQNRLRKGLPDALDLLVVAAEAGLGLETAVDRVAREMEGSNRAIALELNILVQELRMLPDRRTALERMGERTDIEGFKRLAATLSQTLRYGTPLAQAMRVLASELRQERMLRIEEKAIRLPAMLVGPLILFILPALFIALIGPSVLEIGRTMGGTQ
jgi:tight adherence protein C